MKASRRQSRNRAGEVDRGERCEIVYAFADADGVHGKAVSR